MLQRNRRGVRRGWCVDGLESRNLPSAGMSGVADVVRELGPLSRQAAIGGVAATASIDPGDAVTFRFEVEAAASGDYTLLVRHVGEGFSLEAETPAGAATINPGPAGPFEVVRLKLTGATYEVTASDRGGRSDFVDWELLLNTGVGQSPASAPGVILPIVAGASPALTQAPSPTGGPATPAASATPLTGTVPALPPSAFAAEQPPTYLTATQPVGWPSLDLPFSPQLALNSARPISPIDVMLVDTLQPVTQTLPADNVAPLEFPWWSRFFDPSARENPETASTSSILPEQLLAEVDFDADDPGEERVSASTIGSGLALGVVAGTIITRARLKNRKSIDLDRSGSPRSTVRLLLGRVS